MSTKQLIINGRISQREYMYNYTTFIGDIDEPIAKYLQENIYAKNVSVKYFISNTLKEKMLCTMKLHPYSDALLNIFVGFNYLSHKQFFGFRGSISMLPFCI